MQSEQILNQIDNYSSLSAEESFTLEDILQEPDELLQDNLLVIVDPGEYDGMFDDDEDEDEDQSIQNTEVKQEKDKVIIEGPNKQQQNIVVTLPQAQKKISIIQQRQSINNQTKEIIKKGTQDKIVKYERLKRSKMPPLNQIKNISVSVLKNVTSLFQNSQNKFLGRPTVIAATGSKFLAIGTSLGITVIFQIGVKGHKVLGTNQHQKYGQVTAISISKDNKFMAVGQQNSLLSVWDLYSFSELKKELIGSKKIIKITFATENEFILNDSQGNVFLYTIQKYIWVNLKSQKIIQKSNFAYYDVKTHVLQSKTHIIALCTLDHVYLLSLKPKLLPIANIPKPEHLYSSKIPNIQLGRCALFSISSPQSKQKRFNDVICISWSNQIFLYKFNDIGKEQVEKVELIYKFMQPNSIFNMQFMSDGILVTLDNKKTFRTFRIWIKNENSYHLLINQYELPEYILDQKFLKDNNKEYIKSFSNTIISTYSNPKQKQIFFISNDSIYRCRIYRWNEVVSDLINSQRQYQKALKICLEINNSKINLFIQNFQFSEKPIKHFCEIGALFINAKLKQIIKLNQDRVKNAYDNHNIKQVQAQLQEAYEILIEYMIEIKCQQYLFKTIYGEIIKKKTPNDEYGFKFLDCLQIFIRQGLIRIIPSNVLFKEVTQHFLNKQKTDVIDNLIMSLDVKYIPYSQAIQICTNHSLYKALAYVCSTHKQYIQPLNKILERIKKYQKKQMNNAKQIYYAILKDYIAKLLKCQYINGNPIQQNPSEMKKFLSIWLTCSQTFKYFTQSDQSYEKDYFGFLYDMIMSVCDQEGQQSYIHNILKQLIRQRCKEKQLTQLFIKLIFISLDHEEIQIIVSHSQNEMIQKHMYYYLKFVHKYINLLVKLEKIKEFIQKNKQIHYFYLMISSNKDALSQSRILQQKNQIFNYQLTKYILSSLKKNEIAEFIEDLLKIHSQNTMIYMLQKCQLEIVNISVMNIKDQEYRYLIIRKLLKKMRKQQRNNYNILNSKQQKNKKRKKDKIVIKENNQSQNQSQISQQSTDYTVFAHRQLGDQVLEFYIKCLCLYKKQKRIFYEFVYYLKDYQNNLNNIIRIIEPYNYCSCLGLLQESCKNYKQAYSHFEKVYFQYFFEQNYKKLKKAKHCHGRFMRRIFERMLFISQIINTEEQWMVLLMCIISPLQQNSKEHPKVSDYIQSVFQKKKDHPLLLQLGQILELCLINVSNHVPMQIISQFISKHKDIFAYKFVLNSFRSTLVKYSKNSQFYKLTNEMMKNDQINKFDSFYNLKILGVIPQNSCQKCNKSFELNQRMRIYRCGHSYHQRCKTKFLKSSQNETDASQQELQQDRCEKCLIIKTGGNEKQTSNENIPDFNTINENIILKGVKGIVNIIPNMISVIPNPINIFARKTKEKDIQKLQRNSQFEEDEIFEYIEFESKLQQKQLAYAQFIRHYSHELERY